MTFRNIRPLHIMWQAGIEEEMLKGVISGVERVLSLAGVFNEFRLEYLGQRRQPDWLNQDGTLLNAYQSLDWHIEWARRNSKVAGYINSKEPRYELVVVNEPLHWSNNSIRSIGGLGRPGQGAIVTLDGYLHLLQPIPEEKEKDRQKRQADYLLGTQMITMHELGHVFGLFPGNGAVDPTGEEIKKMHCLNECVMCWEIDVWKKIKDMPFCLSCLEKLKQFFIAP